MKKTRICGNILWCMIKFMEEAIKEAKKAEKINEVPVGAVIVKDG